MYVRTSDGLGQARSLWGWPSLGTLPSPTPRVLTYSEVIDNRISVPAQHSLVRLSKKPATSADAVGILEEVKAGRLAGIYCVNWKKAALRAQRFGKSWWTVIPPGDDAVLMLDPDNPSGGQPLIAFRRELDPRDKDGCGKLKTDKTLTPSPARLDAALQKASQSFHLWQTGQLAPCNAGTHGVITALAAVERPPSLAVPVRNVVPAGYCRVSPQVIQPIPTVPPELIPPEIIPVQFPAPTQQDRLIDKISENIKKKRKTPNRLDKAVFEFLQKVDNDELVTAGQFYWRNLVGQAVNGKPACKPRLDDKALIKKGRDLFSQLSNYYWNSSHWGADMHPRNATEVQEWARNVRRVPLSRCDYDALSHARVSFEACFETANLFIVKVLRRVCAFPPLVNTSAGLLPTVWLDESIPKLVELCEASSRS